MKNQYLIIRMDVTDLYDKVFLMRGFNVKRMEKVCGVIAVIGRGLLNDDSKMYHLSRVNIDLLPSDTQQCWGRLSWSNVDAEVIDTGMRRLPVELRDRIVTMRTNRVYQDIDPTAPETIPAVLRDRSTELVYTTSAARKLIARSEVPAPLSAYSVEEIIEHLRTRISGVTITF